MKKIIILLTLLLLTGCSVQYDLEIKDDELIEKSKAIFSPDKIGNDTIESYIKKQVNNHFANDDILIGQQTKYISGDEYGYQIINKYGYENIVNNSIIYSCYDSINITNENEIITINTSSKFNCMDYYDELDNVTIRIKSSLKNISNNADRIEDNIYYWYINRENFENKNISIEFEKTKKFNYSFFIIIGILIIFAIGAMLLYIKHEKNNEL